MRKITITCSGPCSRNDVFRQQILSVVKGIGKEPMPCRSVVRASDMEVLEDSHGSNVQRFTTHLG